MEDSEVLKWAGLYTVLALVATAVALAIAGAGVAVGGLRVVGTFGYEWLGRSVGVFPRAGFALVVIGVVVWWFGLAAAFLKVVVGAIEARTAGALDTEAMKSDILSVLDERLADMQQELGRTRSLVDRLTRDDAASGFDFEEDL